MNSKATRLPYRQTGYFSKTVLDWLDHSDALKPFYSHPSSLQGIQQAIEQRKNFKTDRKTLVQELRKQYKTIGPSAAVQKNIDLLRSENSFTITTAHQPNIFT